MDEKNKTSEADIAEIRTTSFQEVKPKDLMLKLDVLAADRVKVENNLGKAIQSLIGRIVYLEAQTSVLKEVVPNFDELLEVKLDEIHNRRSLAAGEFVTLHDAITVNFTGYKEDQPVAEMSVKEHYFVLNLKNFIPELEKQFLGMAVGEKKTITAAFPEDYPKEEYAGKSFRFDLEVLQAKRNLDIEKEAKSSMN
jgi:hypothetical protein